MAQPSAPARSIDGIRPVQVQSRRRKRGWYRKPIFLLAIVLMVIVLAIGLWFWLVRDDNDSSDLKNVDGVMAAISRHYVLPNDETPALATVTDSSKLTTPFFKKSKDGDKILIYQKNQIAIIYRPSIDRIVALGPVSIDTPPTPSKK